MSITTPGRRVHAYELPKPNRHGRARQALERILADHEDRGRPIPCRVDEADHGRHLSDDPAAQAAAARLCEFCPAVNECAAYAINAAEPAGVWGATTPTGRELSKRAAARAARRHPSTNTKVS